VQDSHPLSQEKPRNDVLQIKENDEYSDRSQTITRNFEVPDIPPPQHALISFQLLFGTSLG
jgi:hypothetical protein